MSNRNVCHILNAQVLAYFLRGKLPWQGLDADTKDGPTVVPMALHHCSQLSCDICLDVTGCHWMLSGSETCSDPGDEEFNICTGLQVFFVCLKSSASIATVVPRCAIKQVHQQHMSTTCLQLQDPSASQNSPGALWPSLDFCYLLGLCQESAIWGAAVASVESCGFRRTDFMPPEMRMIIVVPCSTIINELLSLELPILAFLQFYIIHL